MSGILTDCQRQLVRQSCSLYQNHTDTLAFLSQGQTAPLAFLSPVSGSESSSGILAACLMVRQLVRHLVACLRDRQLVRHFCSLSQGQIASLASCSCLRVPQLVWDPCSLSQGQKASLVSCSLFQIQTASLEFLSLVSGSDCQYGLLVACIRVTQLV